MDIKLEIGKDFDRGTVVFRSTDESPDIRVMIDCEGGIGVGGFMSCPEIERFAKALLAISS